MSVSPFIYEAIHRLTEIVFFMKFGLSTFLWTPIKTVRLGIFPSSISYIEGFTGNNMTSVI